MADLQQTLWVYLCFLLTHLCIGAQLVDMQKHHSQDDTGQTGVGSGPLPEEGRGANALHEPGPCSMLSNLQDAVLQVMTAHYEYGHGIHRLHDIVGQLQTDLNDLKGQLVEVEQKMQIRVAESRINNEHKACKHGHHTHQHRHHHVVNKEQHVSSSSSQNQHHTQLPDEADAYIKLSEDHISSKVSPQGKSLPSVRSHHPHHHEAMLDTLSVFIGEFFNSSMYHERYPSFSGLVHNISTELDTHKDRLSVLQRRLHGVRRHVKQATSTMVTWEKTLKLYDSQMLSHMLDKQMEINTALERRLTNLEESIQLKTSHPRDQPHNYISRETSCPNGFIRHASSCYLFGNETAHWVDAEKHCQRRHANAHLVAIETRDEHEFIIMYRQYNAAQWTSYYVWTGGTNMLEGGGWRWISTQRALAYTKWRAGKPSTTGLGEQHCLYLPTVGDDSQWDDWHCYAARLNYVCEMQV